MAIKKIRPQSPDPYLGKTKGDTEFARLAHLNNLVDQINANSGGGGSVGTLQQVTQTGNTTNVTITLDTANLIFKDETFFKIVQGQLLGAQRSGAEVYRIADRGGTFVMSVNGNSPDNNGNVEIGAGTVPSLQEVMNVNNVTLSTLIIQDNAVEFLSSNASKFLSGGSLSGLNVGGLTFSLPDVGGIIPISVNGITADDNGNITIPDPRPYRVYTALLSKTGTNAPTAIVLENTLGTINYTYIGVGSLRVVSPDFLFTDNKTFTIIQNEPNGVFGQSLGISRASDDLLIISQSNAFGQINDDWQYPVSFEIRVYN